MIVLDIQTTKKEYQIKIPKKAFRMTDICFNFETNSMFFTYRLKEKQLAVWDFSNENKEIDYYTFLGPKNHLAFSLYLERSPFKNIVSIAYGKELKFFKIDRNEQNDNEIVEIKTIYAHEVNLLIKS